MLVKQKYLKILCRTGVTIRISWSLRGSCGMVGWESRDNSHRSAGSFRGIQGNETAVYVGGAFKAFSLLSALRLLGMLTAVVASQTGDKDEYRRLREISDHGTIIVDDLNSRVLARFCIPLSFAGYSSS